MTINNPFIKDPKNIEWLEKNFQTFLDYMSKNHSIADCWHTVLDLSSFNDTYISNMIKRVEMTDKARIKEQKAREKDVDTSKEKPSKIEKKNNVVEEAVAKKEKEKKEAYDLLD